MDIGYIVLSLKKKRKLRGQNNYWN